MPRWPEKHVIDNRDGTHSVPLTRGMFALIDSADLDVVGKWSWHALHRNVHHFYAARTARVGPGRHVITLHRAIVQAPDDRWVDHINGNTLDNRRVNLRLATTNENAWNAATPARNKSGYKGVSLNRRHMTWKAALQHYGREIYIGHFKTAEEAYAAYCATARRLHGEFARTK